MKSGAEWIDSGELEGELTLSEQMRAESSDTNEKQLKKLQAKLVRAERAVQDMGERLEDAEHRARDAQDKLKQRLEDAVAPLMGGQSVRIQNESLEESWISELSEQSTDEMLNVEHDIKRMQLGMFQDSLAGGAESTGLNVLCGCF